MESAKGEVCLSGEGAHKPLGGHRWWAAGKSPNNSWMFIAGKAQTKSDRFFFATTFDYLDMLLMNFHEIWNNLGNFFVFRSSFLGTENTNRDANLGSRHLSAFGVPLKWRVWSASVWQGARPITGRTDLSGRNTCSTQFQYLDKIFILIYLSCAMLSRIIFPCFLRALFGQCSRMPKWCIRRGSWRWKARPRTSSQLNRDFYCQEWLNMINHPEWSIIYIIYIIVHNDLSIYLSIYRSI